MTNKDGMLKHTVFGKKIDLEGFIRDILKEKVRTDPIAKANGFSEQMVDSLTKEQIAGSPEASIVINIFTWKVDQIKGVPNKVIAKNIDQHRASSFPITDPSNIPLNPDPISHIKFRAHLEQPEGIPITDDYIDKAIGLCESGITIDCPDEIKGSKSEPSIPTKDMADDRLIRWIIWDNEELKEIAKLYSKKVNEFIDINLRSIKKELVENELNSAEALIDRACYLSGYYEENLGHLVAAQGGLKFCPVDFQAAMVLILVKISGLLNYARLKYGASVPEDILDMTRNQ